MARKTHHVVPSPNGGWDVKRGGAQRISGHFDRKVDAVAAGRATSIKQGTELIIHDSKGKFQSCDSHGNDPHPPKG